MNKKNRTLRASCLCNGVSMTIKGEFRPVINCHCIQCTKTHGNYAAYTACLEEDITFINKKTLKWYKSSNIAKRAGHLIDKFSGLNDDLGNIGKYLNLAGKAFDAADNKLSSGKGNLFDQIKELEALGAKSKKLISKK